MKRQEQLAEVKHMLEKQRNYFLSGATHSLLCRIQALEKMQEALISNRTTITQASAQDLGRPDYEFDLVLNSVGAMLQHLRSSERGPVKSTSFVHPINQQEYQIELRRVPKGNALIVGPWNSPILCLLRPVVEALAAGNVVAAKPSESSPHTADAIQKAFDAACFDPRLLFFFQSDGAYMSQLLHQFRFDHILYTGGEKVGTKIAKAAAAQLTPVTLELGGRNPTVVLQDADLDHAASCIAQQKLFQSGQTCVSPDYVICENSGIARVLLEKTLRNAKTGIFPFKGRIVNTFHKRRLLELLGNDTEVTLAEELKTDDLSFPLALCMRKVPFDLPAPPDSLDHRLENSETFGPIITFGVLSQTKGSDDFLSRAIQHINSSPSPLNAIIFTKSQAHADRFFDLARAGAIVTNDFSTGVLTDQAPFGGFGASGMGHYFGIFGLESFSHLKPCFRIGTSE